MEISQITTKLFIVTYLLLFTALYFLEILSNLKLRKENKKLRQILQVIREGEVKWWVE